MKIVSVEAIPVNLPFHEPVSDAWGVYASSNHGIVVIRGDSGEYGVGEIALAWFGGAHALCKEVNDLWAEKLVGMRVSDLSLVTSLLDSFCSFSKRHLLAKAGVEMALWDLLGKSLGVPVYELLGGKVRGQIALTGGISMGTVEHMTASAVGKVSEGFQELKLKIGLDEDKDWAALHSIRRAIPDSVRIRVDVNMAWQDVKKAKRIIDRMTTLGVSIVEQPLHSERLSDLAWLRTNIDAILLIDEGIWDVRDARKHLEMQAADMLHVYISEAGGIAASKKIFELASLYEMDCTIGSMPEGKIGAAASAHVGAAMLNLSSHASDIRGFTVYREDVVNEELVISAGSLIVPDRPGLGVTIDFAQLARMRVDQ
ncbi:mandelate racemase/muconate lactonizing enzyme family protein [Paenibacillus eucommiae]|uniref:Muconate cycloisomerase n=1 Tax=Paenibacillus eucommiae TaxID=1355755 RepID=A0ABS4IRM2_9BACL|nr:mandelate racemase/muconate lactonizing enzyme family protein [Paenibacillus eucommiae]MBP1990228.1 muconate cycloisomerase [Paenibacillus eucommiae]